MATFTASNWSIDLVAKTIILHATNFSPSVSGSLTQVGMIHTPDYTPPGNHGYHNYWIGTDTLSGTMDINKTIATVHYTNCHDQVNIYIYNNTTVWLSQDLIWPPASGPANLKTHKGLVKASVKTINGLAIASVKTINGLV